MISNFGDFAGSIEYDLPWPDLLTPYPLMIFFTPIMSNQNEKKKPRSRVRNASHTYLIVFLIAAALLIAAFYFYLNGSSSRSLTEEMVATEQNSDPQAVGQTKIVQDQGESQGIVKKTSQDLTGDSAENENGSAPNHPETNKPGDNNYSQQAKTPLNSASLSSGIQQKTGPEQQLIADINRFYSHLDNQDYMKTYNLKASCKEHFSSLLQKLLDNPPVVTRETDDLFTLLKNTAHFFRVLGKNNLLMLKGILDREKDSFENILKSFYSLINHPDHLQSEYELVIPKNSLYDYAGFFLNTMGGRLYLFRRDSTSRMLVSFYAILVIDQEKDVGNDRHGIDISKPIDSLIDEIENTGKRLRLKEEYLDILYDLKDKYSY